MVRKLVTTVLGLILLTATVSAERVELISNAEDVNVVVEDPTLGSTILKFEIGAFNKEAVEINGQTYFDISTGFESRVLTEGEPQVPHVCRSIVIPDDAHMTVNILAMDYVDFEKTPVVPSKGNLLRTIDPDMVAYTFGPVYSNHDWYPADAATIREPYILRDYRGTVVEVNPFQYNPGTQTLRVYKSITVEIVSDGPGQANVLTNAQRESVVTDFDYLYQSQFLNYAAATNKYTLVPETGSMLIIAYDSFTAAMQPLVDWKNQKGLTTVMVNKTTAGSSATAIQGYIQDYYDTTDVAFVLLVGDNAQIPTLTSGGGGADPLFALTAGSDHYPDLFVGRFSAENTTHVATQVARTITYERDMYSSAWYHKGMGIGSDEGSGGHNGGEYDYTHLGYIRDSLMQIGGYTEVDGIYEPSATKAMITNGLNNGRSIINYTGHGSTTAWSTTGYNNTDVNNLINDNMLPFIVSVACVNGQFRSYTCFAEAWMRATNGGNPTGAIGIYASTINQSWAPPMDGQDEFVRMMIREVANSYGSLCYHSSCKMMDLNSGSTGTSMYDTWLIFGDPSVQVRSADPAPITVNHAGAAFFNISEYEVEVVGVEDALVALSYNGQLFGSAYTGADGIALVPISELLPIGVEITLTVTGYNLATTVEPVMVSTDLTIIHIPLEDTKEIVADYEVACTIFSDTALFADSVLLFYDAGAGFVSTPMSLVRIGDDFVGYIPTQLPGTDVDYYIWAKNVGGYVDQTDTYSFSVIDFGMFMTPDFVSTTAPVDDTIWYTLSVTNDGVLDDTYNLTFSNNVWATGLFDATGAYEITATDLLAANASFDFTVRVIVPSSFEDEYDSTLVTATSVGNGAFSDVSSVVSVSAGMPWPIPFGDIFPTTTLDMTKWELGTGVTLETGGIAPPSEPYSANLDGSRDELQTEQINLRGETNVLIGYWYQRTGGGDSPEAGDNLTVEYLDSLGSWQLLSQQLGDGPDMTEFEEAEAYLPGDAYHAGFRLRFYNYGTAGNYDDWFVDDIFVGHPSDYKLAIDPYSQSQYGPAGGTASFLVTVRNRGLLDDSYDLSATGNTWDVSFWDATGATEITTTPLIAGGDSGQFMAKVAIPAAAAPHANDIGYLHATSQGDGAVTGFVTVETISGGPAIAFPMYEPFADTELSLDRWFSNSGVEISAAALAPPSSPNALHLDGGADEAVSRLIDISGQDGAILSYYYEAGGNGDVPEAGDELVFEYKNDYGEWTVISTQVGDGTAMTSFAYVNVGLPLDAVHAGFQLRITTANGSTGTDDWFVDDIRVDFAPDISIYPSTVDETMGQNTEASDNLIISNNGPGGLTYNLRVAQDMRGGYTIDLPADADMEPAKRTYPAEFLAFDNLKGSIDPNHGAPITRNMGGPDTYGYIWVDSDEGLGGGTEFAWVDVSGTGTDVAGDLADDNYGGPYPLGFTFPFYGANYTEFYVGSNGMIGFDTTAMNSRVLTPLPAATTPNNIIAWYWRDLNPVDADDSANVHVYVSSDGTDCVIQFVDYPIYLSSGGDVVTAEVILSDNGMIKIQYQSFAAGFDKESGTVGIEDASGTDGLEVVYKAAYLHDNLAVTFAKPYEWLTISSASGTVDPGMADTVACIMNSGDLDEGSYGGNIIVYSNDPDPMKNPFMIPINMTVSNGPVYVCGDVNSNDIGPDIEDLIYLVSFMFQDGAAPPNMATADVTGNGGDIDIDDLITLVSFMFQEGPALTCSF